MRKIILNLAVSLDGFIEGANGEFDWCFVDQDYGMTDFFNRIDTIFIGRKSYELISSMEGSGFPTFKSYVFSNTLDIDNEEITVIKGDIVPQVIEIKNQKGKDIWLFGGSNLLTDFINFNLVDEMQISIHPILLGQGKPLFLNIEGRKKWVLKNVKTYNTGLVQVFYEKT